MSQIISNPSSAVSLTTSGVAQNFATTLDASETGPGRGPGKDLWQITCSAAAWFAQGASPTAAAGAAGSVFLPPNVPMLVDGWNGATLSVIQDSGAGKCTLVRMLRV